MAFLPLPQDVLSRSRPSVAFRRMKSPLIMRFAVGLNASYTGVNTPWQTGLPGVNLGTCPRKPFSSLSSSFLYLEAEASSGTGVGSHNRARSTSTRQGGALLPGCIPDNRPPTAFPHRTLGHAVPGRQRPGCVTQRSSVYPRPSTAIGPALQATTGLNGPSGPSGNYGPSGPSGNFRVSEITVVRRRSSYRWLR